MDEENLIYCIDEKDVVISVSQNWQAFAFSNGWRSDLSPETVVGRSLWGFIEDAATRHLYKEIFRKVRAGNPIGPIPFRCDSPNERRFLKLSLCLLPGSQIKITSRIIKTEARDPIGLLDKDMKRSSDFIRICSMCKKIWSDHNKWVEIEDGLSQLKPFNAGEMPKLTHGLCNYCYRAFIADQKILD